MSQGAIGAPLFGQFHHGAAEVAVILLQLLLKPGEQRQGIGGASGETRHHFLIIETADFAGLLLDDVLAHGHLAVASHGEPSVAPDAEYRCVPHSDLILHARPSRSL